MLTNLHELLTGNEIPKEKFENLTYLTLLLSLFEKIYIELQSNPVKKKRLLTKLRNSNNEELMIKNFLYEKYDIKISDHSATLITKWLICYYRKNGVRAKYSKNFKEELLNKQNCSCNTCQKTIRLENSHLDHIIPWAFVGDELENNLHFLCTDCNYSKSKSVTFLFSTLLMHTNNIEYSLLLK